MIPGVYRYKKLPEDVPDDPRDDELESKRDKADNIGGALGAATGIGMGYWRANKSGPPLSIITKLVAATTAGYAMGRAGAYTYNTMFNPRPNELQAEQAKTASSAPDIAGMAIPEEQKDLLAMSRMYVAKKRLMATQGQQIKRQNELAPPQKAPAKPVKKEAMRLSVPVIMMG